MKRKLLASLLVGATMMSTMVSPVFAADSSATTEVQIETKATDVDITVPGDGGAGGAAVTLIFNADGTDTLPDFPITNNGKVNIKLTDAKFTGAGWQLYPESQDQKTMPKDTKTIKLKFGEKSSEQIVAPEGGSTAASGTATFAGGIAIGSSEKKTLGFAVEHGAFTSAEGAVKAFDVQLNFDFE